MPAFQEIDDALRKLGLDESLSQHTDANFLQKMLEDLGLNDFKISADHPEHTQLNTVLVKLKTEAIPLGNFKNKVITALAGNEPLAHTILAAAASLGSEKLSAERREQLKYMIHLMVVLEVLTTLMVNDKDFAQQVAMHLLKNRGLDNPGDMTETFLKVFQNTNDIFAPLKLCSVDPGMWRFMCWREYGGQPTADQVEAFIKDHNLTGANVSCLRNALDQAQDSEHRGLRTNIIEAVLRQKSLASGGEDNAQAGLALIHILEINKGRYPAEYKRGNPAAPYPDLVKDTDPSFWDMVYQYKPTGNTYSAITQMPKEWVDLYISWNMEFISSQFPDLAHLTSAKLLIPCTLGADPESYMATRVLSLWLTVNFVNRLLTLAQPKIAFKFAESEQFKGFIKIFGGENFNYAKSIIGKLAANFSVEALQDNYKKNFSGKEEYGVLDWIKLGLKLYATTKGYDVARHGGSFGFYANKILQSPGKSILGVGAGLVGALLAMAIAPFVAIGIAVTYAISSKHKGKGFGHWCMHTAVDHALIQLQKPVVVPQSADLESCYSTAVMPPKLREPLLSGSSVASVQRAVSKNRWDDHLTTGAADPDQPDLDGPSRKPSMGAPAA